ncbi:hypothetical protein ABEV09_07295 [Schinkia azotoformans]|uniref:hypothetical protein n=1 Tax=Schinkia azotoformans TaxID=1454 RepID=UPI002DBE2004|nr:hypothetical protein [Schinkia azotoformans]MEC1717212.1 hypothetical protein [Schinkia azotoformans]
MSNQLKDSRLWNKGNGVIPFATRSQKLAVDLMKTVGMKDSIIESFMEGRVLRTNGLNPLSILQENLTEIDEEIISDLDKNGLSVYHVLLSYFMAGKQTEIQCEHEVSTYEKVITSKSYLCVPKDIFAEAMTFDEDVTNESNRETVIKECIEHEIFMANQGYLYAYVVSDEDGFADFYNLGVNLLNGELLRVS